MTFDKTALIMAFVCSIVAFIVLISTIRLVLENKLIDKILDVFLSLAMSTGSFLSIRALETKNISIEIQNYSELLYYLLVIICITGALICTMVIIRKK